MTSWLRQASVASREAQVTSSEYFVEDAEQKILSGMHAFQEPSYSNSAELATSQMIHGFSFAVWLNPPSSGAEKAQGVDGARPIASAIPTLTSSSLSCWSWATRGEEVLLEYGAHDHPRVTTQQESVVLAVVPGRRVETKRYARCSVRGVSMRLATRSDLLGIGSQWHCS
eukprot:2713221-Amphidinium_carterae.1